MDILLNENLGFVVVLQLFLLLFTTVSGIYVKIITID